MSDERRPFDVDGFVLRVLKGGGDFGMPEVTADTLDRLKEIRDRFSAELRSHLDGDSERNMERTDGRCEMSDPIRGCDGEDCECWAAHEGECSCGADWTPKEVYELRVQLADRDWDLASACELLSDYLNAKGPVAVSLTNLRAAAFFGRRTTRGAPCPTK